MIIRTAMLVIVAFAFSYTQTLNAQNVSPAQLKKLLKQFPQADTNKDGVLSIKEAAALRDQARAGRQGKAKNIAPPVTHENVKYGPWDRNVFDIWIPESKLPTPLIVYIHGGGFVGGSKEQVRQTKNVQQALDHGVAFASIQYRFRYPDDGDTSDPQRAGLPNILRDSARAIQYLRYHAKDYNLDPARIACYGGSAGAGTSIWLAFRDDLADPTNPDPVLRESSRISAAGMLNGQFTYDLSQWDDEFTGRDGNLVETHGNNGKLELHKFLGLTEEEYNGPTGAVIRADVDMRAMITADDPPVFILTGNADVPVKTRGIYNHHPLHAQLIQERCIEVGGNVVCLLPKVNPDDAATLQDKPDTMMEFFFQHLGASTSETVTPDSETEQQSKTTTPLPVADPASVGMDPEALDRIKPTLQGFVDEKKIPGAVVAVARRGKLVWLDSVGFQDIDAETPMQTDTVFRIYSMTKPVTSVAAMILVEQGKLKLDDPVSKYISEFAAARVFVSMDGDDVKTEPLQRAITIRDLMRHTSGLTYGFFGNSPVDQMYRKADVLSDSDDNEALAKKVAGIPSMYQPGTRFEYSVSVDVLGRVIEVVSGQTLDVFMRERIFEPLGMHDTGFYVAKESRRRLATNYSPQIGGGLKVSDASETSRFASKPKMLSGGGGLVSTASDYLRFAQMLLNGGELGGVRILEPETVATMTSNQLPTKAYPIQMIGIPMPGVGFGLGFSVVVEKKLPVWSEVVGEYGWDGMASTHFWSSADKELTVVVLTQHVPYSGQLKIAIKPLVYDAILSSFARQR